MSQEKLSLETAANKNYKSIPWEFVGNASFNEVHRNAFIAGAKFREAQLLEIVNQMKAALEFVSMPLTNINTTLQGLIETINVDTKRAQNT